METARISETSVTQPTSTWFQHHRVDSTSALNCHKSLKSSITHRMLDTIIIFACNYVPDFTNNGFGGSAMSWYISFSLFTLLRAFENVYLTECTDIRIPYFSLCNTTKCKHNASQKEYILDTINQSGLISHRYIYLYREKNVSAYNMPPNPYGTMIEYCQGFVITFFQIFAHEKVHFAGTSTHNVSICINSRLVNWSQEWCIFISFVYISEFYLWSGCLFFSGVD